VDALKGNGHRFSGKVDKLRRRLEIDGKGSVPMVFNSFWRVSPCALGVWFVSSLKWQPPPCRRRLPIAWHREHPRYGSVPFLQASSPPSVGGLPDLLALSDTRRICIAAATPSPQTNESFAQRENEVFCGIARMRPAVSPVERSNRSYKTCATVRGGA
jgi:hypothetical protein